MLVMRRRPGESFLIGPDIEIEILEVSHGRVRIGISAPDVIPIVRKEVVLTREENLSASKTMPADTIAWIGEHLRASGGALTGRQEIDGNSVKMIFKKE